MAHTLTCPQGHTWDAAVAAADKIILCPVCGSSAALPPHAAPTLPVDAAPPGAPSGPPSPPGYEILGELGRGGMGVVYKARHFKLNRVVALKMLTAGAHAGPDLLLRFQREAESLARLTHPNIVQIHEVGWVEPHGPYFTLEYVEGGSLWRKLGGAPQPPRYAAEVVAVLARAVHFAHERGVLHRDLKPGNVLLAADGSPKVTDFGLARFLEAEAAAAADSPTPTGAVLGTPSYMAPEQAGGVTKAPTPAADIYSLGAILYEMLTGRPPFLADGPLETTLRVLTDDPVPPRRLRPKVPRDLETICLHCLRKAPRQRYPSADVLADDLQRYLDDKPIRVRPAGAGERLVKWARRRPTAAALVAVSLLAALAGLGVWGWFSVRLAEANANLQTANGNLRAEKEQYNGLLVASVDAVGDYGDLVDETVAPLPRSEQARRLLLERRLEFYAPFLRLDADKPELKERKAKALCGAADVHRKLGDVRRAEDEFDEAIGLYETAIERTSATPELRRELGLTRVGLGALLTDLNRHPEAERQYDQGIDLLQKLADEGGDATTRANLAVAYHRRAGLRSYARRWDDALDDYGRAVDLCESLLAEDDKNDRYRILLAGDYADRGGLYRRKGEPGRGRADVEAALNLLRRLGPDYAEQEGSRDALAGVRYQHALLQAASDPAGACRELDEAARGWDQLHEEFPTAPRYAFQAADAFLLLGRLLRADDRVPEAEAALRRAEELHAALAEKWKDEPAYRDGRESSRYYLALALKRQAKFDEAARLLAGLVESSPKNAEYQTEYGEATLARAAASSVRARILGGLPPFGLTVFPVPVGMGQGYVGQQLAARAEMTTARNRYRLCLEHLRLAAENGDALSADERQALARTRFTAAQGLFGPAQWLGDDEAMAAAADALADLAASSAPEAAARAFRLAALYAGVAAALSPAEARGADHARRMLQLLHKAVENGFHDAAALRASPDVQALLNTTQPHLRDQREELKRLLADLESRSRP